MGEATALADARRDRPGPSVIAPGPRDSRALATRERNDAPRAGEGGGLGPGVRSVLQGASHDATQA
jgi:hypothetical protein